MMSTSKQSLMSSSSLTAAASSSSSPPSSSHVINAPISSNNSISINPITTTTKPPRSTWSQKQQSILNSPTTMVQEEIATPHSINVPHIIPAQSAPSTSTTTTTMTEIEEERILLKEKSINEIRQQCSTLIHELEGNKHPELIIKKHIQQLNKYNELKDLALQLISLIANQKKVKIIDILNEMNLNINDDNENNDSKKNNNGKNDMTND